MDFNIDIEVHCMLNKIPIKDKARTHLLEFVKSYYNPKYLGVLAVHTLQLPKNPDLINFLS